MPADKSFFHSLRGRFIFYFLILSFLSLVLLGTVFGFFVLRQKHREETQARSELTGQAQDMAVDLEIVLALGQYNRVSQLLRLEGDLANATGLVIDNQGDVVAPLPLPLSIPRKLDTSLIAKGDVKASDAALGGLGKVFLVAIPLQNGQNPTYYNLVLAKSVSNLAVTSTGEIMRNVLIASAIALGLSILLALLLSSYVLKPLRNLTHAAWDLAHGNMDRRVEVTGRDEISELSEYFNYMAERIQKNSQLQKDFVANVSHEIRTPLTSIEGFSQALHDDMVSSEEDRKRYLNIIFDESRRMKRLVSQLLALSRIDAGGWVLRPAPLSLSDFISEIGEKFQPLAIENNLSLSVESDAETPSIETDRDTLEQILQNLIENAIKFTPPGGKIVLSSRKGAGDTVLIEVKDDGRGIPEEGLSQIFDRFVRVERSRSKRFGGAGLGLAICRDLVGLLGGRINVESVTGKGTTFTIQL
jgi:signal transduction histidine kinase